MSVFENYGRRRGSERETPPGDPKVAAPAEKGRPPRWARRERDDDPLIWGVSYDRAEGVIHLLLAFSIVGGAAALLGSGVFIPADASNRQAQAPAAPAPPAIPAAEAEKTPIPVQAASLDPEPPAEADAIALAPKPLAPPSAALREKLGPVDTPAQGKVAAPPAREVEAPADQTPAPEREAGLAPPKTAQPSPEEAKTEEAGRMAHCYLRLAGRVQAKGSCRVRRTEDTVILQLPGKPLEISHAHGRIWTATLGGRSLGRVYRSGPCWGARGFYACESG